MPPTRPELRIPALLLHAPPTRPEPWLPVEHEDHEEQGGPEEPGAPDGPQEQKRRSRKWTAVVAGLVIVFTILAAYDLLSDRGALTAQTRSGSTSHAAATRSEHARSPSATASTSPPATGPASPSVSSSPVVRELSAVSASAFGPDGTSDGDDSSRASRVLAGDGVNPWTSSWYKTADFGNLQAGTGLLLDMGAEVSVSRVRVVLGDSVGANLSLRLGDTADPAGLTTVSSASDVGGTVSLSPPSPVRARYVLIWFTRLPPDNAGTYQVLVYSVKVSGHS